MVASRRIVERVHALFILGWALVRSLVAGLFGLRRGLVDFQRSYAPDRLQPVSPADRAAMPAFSGCIACGLCDVGEGVRIASSRGAYCGTMDLMLASSRSMPDHDAALVSFAATSDARLAELEARCPTRGADAPDRRVGTGQRTGQRTGDRAGKRHPFAFVTRSRFVVEASPS